MKLSNTKHETFKPKIKQIYKKQKINRKGLKFVPCFHGCVEYYGPQSRFDAKFFP